MNISEIFFSFQGEGVFIGHPQIFIRFTGCNLQCDYCDEAKKDRLEKKYTVPLILEKIAPYLKYNIHSVSLTGGEPLLQIDAIKKLIPHINIPILLETNGTLSNHLIDVADQITYFSVDFKPGFSKEFIDFIFLLKDKPGVYVKYILKRDFPIQEIDQLTKILSKINPDIPLVLQPITPFSGNKEKATEKDIFRAFNIAQKKLKTVRIIPQTHKLMGIQ